MSINRRDIVQMLRDENELLKARNQQVSNKLARHQQAFRVLAELDDRTRSLSHDLDLPDLLNELLAVVMHACNTENGSLILIDETTNELEFVAVIGESHDHLLNHRISLDTGLVGHVIKNRKPLLVEDVHNSREWASSIDQRLDFHTSSLMCVPVTIEDEVIGAIEVVNHTHDTPFDFNDLNILHVACRMVSKVLECVYKLTLDRESRDDDA
jgi:transcriptional regulator with GAF, ATPase, and Fis domain